MWMRAIVVVVCLHAACIAADPPTNAALPKDYLCVCEITNGNAGGSGALVGIDKEGFGIVVSCAHLFGDGIHSPVVKFRGHESLRATVLAMNKADDISAIRIMAPKDIPTPPCVRVAHKEDSPFHCVGFPWYSRGEPHFVIGDGIGYQGSDFRTTNIVYSGFSGGPRFNRFGEYTGPVDGCTNGGGMGRPLDRTWGPSGPALKRFLSQWVEVKE